MPGNKRVSWDSSIVDISRESKFAKLDDVIDGTFVKKGLYSADLNDSCDVINNDDSSSDVITSTSTTTTETTSNFYFPLPDVVLQRIFNHLPSWQARTRCQRVCRQWHQVVALLWQQMRVFDTRSIGVSNSLYMNSNKQNRNNSPSKNEGENHILNNDEGDPEAGCSTGSSTVNRISSDEKYEFLDYCLRYIDFRHLTSLQFVSVKTSVKFMETLIHQCHSLQELTVAGVQVFADPQRDIDEDGCCNLNILVPSLVKFVYIEVFSRGELEPEYSFQVNGIVACTRLRVCLCEDILYEDFVQWLPLVAHQIEELGYANREKHDYLMYSTPAIQLPLLQVVGFDSVDGEFLDCLFARAPQLSSLHFHVDDASTDSFIDSLARSQQMHFMLELEFECVTPVPFDFAERLFRFRSPSSTPTLHWSFYCFAFEREEVDYFVEQSREVCRQKNVTLNYFLAPFYPKSSCPPEMRRPVDGCYSRLVNSTNNNNDDEQQQESTST